MPHCWRDRGLPTRGGGNKEKTSSGGTRRTSGGGKADHRKCLWSVEECNKLHLTSALLVVVGDMGGTLVLRLSSGTHTQLRNVSSHGLAEGHCAQVDSLNRKRVLPSCVLGWGKVDSLTNSPTSNAPKPQPSCFLRFIRKVEDNTYHNFERSLIWPLSAQ